MTGKIRYWIVGIAAITWGLTEPALVRAQDAQTEATNAEETGANSVQVQQERVESLIAALEDEPQRQELIAQLRLLLESQAAATPPDQVPTVGDELLGGLSRQFVALGDAVDAILSAPSDIVEMWSWLSEDMDSSVGRARWQDILLAAGLCLAAGFAVFFVIRFPVRRLGRRLSKPEKALFVKVLRGAAGFLLDALPVAGFAAAGAITLAALEVSSIATALTANLLDVITIALATCALIRVITRPRRPEMRLLPVSEGVARDLTRRMFWVVGIMSVAYGIVQTLPLVGMPYGARTAFLTLAALISAALLINLAIRHRRPVRQAMERAMATGSIIGDLVHSLARGWHVLAAGVILVLLITYIVGGDRLFVGTVVQIGWSMLALVAASGIWRLVVAFNARQDERTKLKAAETDGEAVRQSGHMLLRLAARLAIAVAIIALLVHIWLFDVVDWLGNESGRALVEATITIVIILALAFAANQAIAAIIDRIQRTRRSEATEHRRRRVETLLPLLRSAAAVIISAVALLIILSEIGLDITPLLASAGVIGLAIGFGAQSLVKDVITGLFILMEDAVGIGDVVTVAGYSGVVEEMTIRTIRLRDFGGNIHVIPFGVVDAATNMTRDFSYAVFDIGVSYNADVDQVIACMNDIDTELRADAEMRRQVLEPIQIVGLDSFGDSAVVIKARIKTLPGQQWSIFRAYNRLLKKTFDERGIEIPFPQMTLHTPAITNPVGVEEPGTKNQAASEKIDSVNMPGEIED